jgi:mannose-1-phosphate guanylyltransferase/mannose-6-phosphate isomerase
MIKFAIILCGGIGERLWPVSTEDVPKQFHNIISNTSLLDQTIKRLPNNYHIILVSNIRYKSYLEYNYPTTEILYEPLFKGNAISILLASEYIKQNYGLDHQAIVLPSDHYFEDEYFSNMIEKAFNELDELTIFGVTPTYPEIGYGYIKHSEGKLLQFIEKPSKEIADNLIQNGCLWNVGIFIFKIKTILDLYAKRQPEMYQFVLSINISKIDATMFENILNTSFDYAIMEHVVEENIGNVIEFNGVWNDVGDWNRLAETIENKKNVQSIDCVNCYIKSDRDNVLAIGLTNIIAVDHGDNMLICCRDSLHKLKSVLPKVKSSEVKYRLWGFYKDIYRSDRERIKKISVYPGKRLSLQYHNYRTENWTITKGIAKVQVGNNVFYKKESETIFIPVKEIHRIENDTEFLIEFIEIQLGDYLEEDDIVRLEDDYGRV